MLVVKIELWPHGNPDKGRVLASLFVTNDCSGSPTTGNYKVRRYKGMGPRYHKMSCHTLLRRATIRGHRRKTQSVWRLVAQAIEATLPNREK